MKILMVTPYPPVRDGIASYAQQSVARLRADGNDVEVLSPGPSAAHHHLHLVGPRGALALALRVRRYDRIIVQFHPDVFFPFPASAWQWRTESLALFAAFLCARDVEIRLHEIDYSRGTGGRALRFVNRLPWRAVSRVIVHTEVERKAFSEAFGIPLERITVTAHGADFRRSTELSKAEARASLGVPADDVMFLNIGFIQPHKGFDRSVRALAVIRASGIGGACRLDIVGSVRTPDPAYLSYLEELRELVDATDGAFLHDGYVSAELFDRWLVACDVVVLPYRSIWSSSVLERALLYDRAVIATDVGGLSLQTGMRDGVTIVKDDVALAKAMGNVVSGGAAGVAPYEPPASWVGVTAVNRSAIQDEIRERAGSRRRAVGSSGWDVRGKVSGDVAPSTPVRNVLPLVLPEPASARPGGKAIKRLLRRLTAWEIEPLVRQVNSLRAATIQALDADHATTVDSDQARRRGTTAGVESAQEAGGGLVSKLPR